MKWITAAVVLTIVAGGSALAVPLPPADPLPPQAGLYQSPDQSSGGLVLTGRFSESWINGIEGNLGNTINAFSWDGSTLGTQWHVWCPRIGAPPVLTSDTLDSTGTGEKAYRTTYAGGRFWFGKTGPWSADNQVDFTGSILTFRVDSTHLYVGGTRISVRSNVVMTGIFDQQYPSWDPSCLEHSINNASIQGTTPQAPFAAQYPDLLDPVFCPGYGPPLPDGAWGTATQITLLRSGCSVPTQDVTWGQIKSRYGN